MFRNVLVGVDGSTSAVRALAEAIEIARAAGGRLGLLSVAADPSPWISLALPPFVTSVSRPRLAAELEAQAQRHLDRAEQAVPVDMPVTKLLRHGSVSRAVLEQTRNGVWDLIVVGHRSSADRRPRRRGVATRLLRASPVPVLVVCSESTPAPPPRPSPIARRSRARFRPSRRSAATASAANHLCAA